MDTITARPARSRWRRLAAVAIGATLAAGGVVATAAAPAIAEDCSAYPWMDASKSSEVRANALLAASTLVGVTNLVQPELLLEVEVVVALDAR